VSQRLLLADDSITIQKVVELILAEEDFEIKSVNNGEEALAVISSFMPDIILADIEMPKVNGYQLCETIKRNPAMNSIPVILLTGAFEPIDEELAKQVQADDFIIKPFESQELISKINAVLTISSVAEAGFTEEAAVEAEAVELKRKPSNSKRKPSALRKKRLQRIFPWKRTYGRWKNLRKFPSLRVGLPKKALLPERKSSYRLKRK